MPNKSDALQENLALSSVQEMAGGGGLPIVASSSTGLKKPVDTLAMIPQEKKINPLARKLYFTMMWFAQQQGWASNQEVFRAPLKEVLKKMGFDSKNLAVIKAHLGEMTTTKVEWQSPTVDECSRWGVSGMIADAEIISSPSGNILEWSYAPKIRPSIMDPKRFARTSLEVQEVLSTNAAMVIYDICSRYINSSTGLTPRKPWRWWRPVLTGAPDSEKSDSEFKIFNRDVLKRGMAEVNTLTNINVTLITHKLGKRVEEIQFHAERKKSFTPPLRRVKSEHGLREIGRAIAAGVTQAQAELFLENHGEEAMSQGVQVLEDRQANVNLRPVDQPEKYLKAVLENPPIDANSGVLINVKSEQLVAKTKRLELLDRYRDMQRAFAKKLFEESNDQAQHDLINEFEIRVVNQTPSLLRTYKIKGLTSQMIKAHFEVFLCVHFFGEMWNMPNDDELLTFSLRSEKQ